mmetsp:Transcript_14608/g.21540  ORF Transcript_14608/g.21540 Transcript_14608/m.21540 type:complete len:269 (+) Transcript_14608:1-807(+)
MSIAFLLYFSILLPATMAMTTFSSLQLLAKYQLNKLPPGEKNTRQQILKLTALVGELSASFLVHAPLDSPRAALQDLGAIDSVVEWKAPGECCRLMGGILFQLALAASSCELSLHECIKEKIKLNGRKYPVELCKGKSGKYTKYSSQTGITKTEGQSIQNASEGEGEQLGDESVDSVVQSITAFATARHWARFHTPRNIVLALVGELGELAELYQWCGDGVQNHDADFLDKVGQELADVGIYLLRLSYVCNVEDIGKYAILGQSDESN